MDPEDNMDGVTKAHEFSENNDDARMGNQISKQDGTSVGTQDRYQDQYLNNNTIIQRESYIPAMHRPGAHPVPGYVNLMIRGAPLAILDTRDETIPSQNPDVLNVINDEEVSLGIIDGIAIPTSSVSRKRTTFFFVLFLSCCIIGMVCITAIIMRSADFTERAPPSSSPTLLIVPPSSSPTLSAAPTSALNDHIKELIFPLSDKNRFDDATSPQTFSLQKIIYDFNSPRFLRETNISLDDDDLDFHITQRYIVTVVMTSAAPISEFKPPTLSRPYISVCTLFSCNEDGEIRVIAFPRSTVAGGTIATEIGLLPALTHILFSESLLSGTIPTEISNLTNLHTLDLKGNNLNGSIPTELGHMHNLKWFFVQKNEISGIIPSSFGNMTDLVFIDLSENQLTGTIPTQIGVLENLKGLSLHGNNFFGDVNYLCSNFHHGNYHKTVSLGDSMLFNLNYRYEVEFGISISCEESEFFCACCSCK